MQSSCHITELKTIGNDYDYPSLNKRDTMKNKPLNSSDFRIRKFKQIDTNRNYSFNNYVLDIEGACPRQYGFYSLKPDYTNTNKDIDSSEPKSLYRYLNKPDYTLSNKDIDYSTPKPMSHFSTNRHVNPLCPDYPLPLTNPTHFPSPVRHFLRDNIDVSDIQGTHPKRRHNKFTRDNMLAWSTDDDTQMKKKIRSMRNNGINGLIGSKGGQMGIYDNIDYSDVSKKNGLWSRCVNPLDPVYELRYEGGENYVHGDIEGSKPCSFSKYNCVSTNLSTSDIKGAQANTKNPYVQWKENHNGKAFSYVLPEIEKSQSSTLKKGVTTTRCLNPLEPDYQFLDRNEINKTNETKVNRRYQMISGDKGNVIEEKNRFLSEGNECMKNKDDYYKNQLADLSSKETEIRNKFLMESYTQTDANSHVNADINTNEASQGKMNNYDLNELASSLNIEKKQRVKPQFNKENYYIKGIYNPIVHDKSLIPIPSANTFKTTRVLQTTNKSPNPLSYQSQSLNYSNNKPYEYQLDSLLKNKQQYF